MEENSEAESVGASSSGGSSSENETERAGKKRQKLQGKEDFISALPDSLLQHILSFLPSTKQAIQTGILSKRWQNQWSHVPILIFNYTGKPDDDNISQSIDNTLMLHNCSKIKKFYVRYDCYLGYDPQITSKIRFATRKNVEELILHLHLLGKDGEDDPYTLPKFLFDNASLVKLDLFKCSIGNDRRPNWSSLKELKLECSYVYDSAIEKLVSGSPLLESLQLTRCMGFNNVVIASKSLKRLIFVDTAIGGDTDQLEILCPNLEELSVKISKDWVDYSELPNQTIENVLSGSHFLHTLELLDCGYSDRLVIASKSLKKLVLGEFYGTRDFEISCPDLDEVNLCRFDPDFSTVGDFKSDKSRLKRLLAMKIVGQLRHVKLLEIGSWFIEIISALEVEGLSSSPLLNCKSLTLHGTIFDAFLPGIVSVIRSSPVLEKLVIKLQLDQSEGRVYLKDCRKENYRNSNETLFNCSVSNLKTVKIIGLSGRDGKHQLEFKFVEFLLKNARMLDKIVIILADCGAVFPFEVSQKLLSFQRCFPHTTIDLLCSN